MSEASTIDPATVGDYIRGMDGPYIAEVASLVGDPARANILVSLLGGQALTATELSHVAGVSASTTSGHLAKLVEGRLLSATPLGRHRYFRLASAKVAELLEVLMEASVDGPPRYRPRSIRDPALAEARTCYNHLAGRIAVAIADQLRHKGLIDLGNEAGVVTPAGEAFFAEFGLLAPVGARRTFCRPCLDWSERRVHIGGAFGASLLARFEVLNWIARNDKNRVVRITHKGRIGLRQVFDIDPGNT